jgi:light-regulated signal transduction histidine kinase (bacteriophytochrome)
MQRTRHMEALIDDLLSFSRVSRTEMKKSEIDMTAMARSVFQELLSPKEQSRIDFHVDALPIATGDPALIHQVWTNLLSNAIKFSAIRERPVIRVTSGESPGESVYVVRDEGAGFNMEYASKLFGVFQRLHSESEFPGTGIGLAIVQRIVRRHGGRVWAEGEEQKGATFFFSLPVPASG